MIFPRTLQITKARRRYLSYRNGMAGSREHSPVLG